METSNATWQLANTTPTSISFLFGKNYSRTLKTSYASGDTPTETCGAVGPLVGRAAWAAWPRLANGTT